MIISVFVLILALSVVIALLAMIGGKAANMDDYVVAGRSFSGFLLFFLSVGEIYSIGTLFAFPGGIYAKGASYGIWFLGYILLAYPVGYFVGPLLWRAGKKYGALTTPDVFRGHYHSRGLEIITGVAVAGFLVPWAQYQFAGLEVSLHALGLDLSGTTTIVIATVVAAVYVLLTGVRSPAMVSILKDATMVLAIIVVGVLAVNALQGVPHVFSQAVTVRKTAATMTGKPLVYAISTIIVQAVAFYLGTTSTNYLFTSRSERTIKRTQIVQPLYMLMYPFLVFAAFYSVAKLHLSNSNFAFAAAARALGPGWVVGLVAGASALAGFLVLAGLALAFGAIVTRNFIPGMSPHAQRRWIVIVMALFLVASAVLAGTVQTILLNILTFAYLIAAQMVPAWVMTLYARRVHKVAIGIGILAGTSLAIGLSLAGASFGGVNVGLVAMVINFVLTIGLSRVLTSAWVGHGANSIGLEAPRLPISQAQTEVPR